MRITINISFPNDLYIFIRERALDGSYASTSEYIRALVREDRVRNEGKTERTRPRRSIARKANDYMA
jgi:Arc/MetJ-type ribon-helix-helix transcriptional regulator